MVWAHWGRFLKREGGRDTDPVCKKGHHGAGESTFSSVWMKRPEVLSLSRTVESQERIRRWRGPHDWLASNRERGCFERYWPSPRGWLLWERLGRSDGAARGGDWNPRSRELCRELEGREGQWQVESNERMCDERGKQYQLRRLREKIKELEGTLEIIQPLSHVL